ncbi:MAG TPA: hypothetical protein VEN31_08060 [Candidatus Bathyarchaeia archaeon]|nr:hypothetical protein [Candidatus Bathyarchaeia archaeon]
MLPLLTFTPKRFVLGRRRLLLTVSGTGLLVLSILFTLLAPTSRSADELTASKSLAERLSTSTWGLAVPLAWLAAPLAEVRNGDSVDLLAVRSGDRPLAVAIAADLRVMGADERSIIFEVDEESASAIATARASGLLIVPLLRSTH